MHVLTRKTLREYGEANAQVRDELNVWFTVVSLAQWSDFNAVRADMPATDYIGNDRYVFNVKGNHYRLIAMIFFPVKQVYIRGIFTHAAYSKLSKKQLQNL